MSAPKSRVQSLFNRIAAPYAKWAFACGRAETRRDAEWLRPQGDERVLDLACGPGTLGLELASRARAVFGFDLAERMVAQARRAARTRRTANSHFAVADGERLPLASSSFDLVACSFSLANFPAPQRVVAEMCRVLRPGGRLAVLEVVAPPNAAQRRQLNRFEEMRSSIPARLLCLTDLLALFVQANLHLVDGHVDQRQRRLDDWLALGACGDDRRGRRRLRETLLQTVKKSDPGLHFGRRGGHWVFYHTVARLLWRKQAAAHPRE